MLVLGSAAVADPPAIPGVSVVDNGGEADERVRAAAESDHAEWSAEEWIAAVDERAERLAGLRYSVLRSTDRGEVHFEERWRLVMEDRQRFRVDYFGDTARQITCDGDHLVDYVPAMGRAMRFDLHAMEATEVKELIGRIMSKVAVPGFRIGNAEGVAWEIVDRAPHEGRPAVFLEGHGGEESLLRYVIDRERVALLRTELEEDGQVVLRTDSSDHREIAPGVYFPHEVRLRSPSEGGEVRSNLRLTKVAAVEDAADALFKTVLDPSIPIEERP